MNKIKNYLSLFILFLFIYLLFKYNYIINKSVIDSVNLWITKVFPSLFIMFILNDIIINTNILKNITIYVNPFFNKIFNTNNNSFEAFLLSIFSGTPSSAFILKEMTDNNKIDTVSANKLISFTFFSNPLFLYNILSVTFNKYIVFKIILIHYLTNIIIGLLYRKNMVNSKLLYNNTYKNYNFLQLISNSIKKSMDTLLMILGTITFYMISTNLLLSFIKTNTLVTILIKGIFEITQSLNILNLLEYQSIIKEVIAISIISFGGLSIHTQVLSIINKTKISYKNFFIGRILHTIISAFTYIICSIVFAS